MTNTTTIKTGKSQFNAKEAKNFRSIMAKYYDARHALNDETLLRNNRIKSLKSVIDADTAQIAKIENGETVTGRTLEEIQTEILEFNSKIETEKSNFETLATAQKKRLMDAEELATTALYNAYKEATLTDEKLPDYINGIADFFTVNGVIAGQDTCEMLATATGRKNSSAKQAFNSGNLTGVMGINAWKKLFLGTLADLMVAENVFSVYKYTFTLPEKKNK